MPGVDSRSGRLQAKPKITQLGDSGGKGRIPSDDVASDMTPNQCGAIGSKPQFDDAADLQILEAFQAKQTHPGRDVP